MIGSNGNQKLPSRKCHKQNQKANTTHKWKNFVHLLIEIMKRQNSLRCLCGAVYAPEHSERQFTQEEIFDRVG